MKTPIAQFIAEGGEGVWTIPRYLTVNRLVGAALSN